MQSKPLKPYVRLSGENGNAYAVIGACRLAARQAGWSPELIKQIEDEMMSGSYDHLLQVVMYYFDVH
jgi:hypothetical protein